jgi:hypothetical protein
LSKGIRTGALDAVAAGAAVSDHATVAASTARRTATSRYLFIFAPFTPDGLATARLQAMSNAFDRAADTSA